MVLLNRALNRLHKLVISQEALICFARGGQSKNGAQLAGAPRCRFLGEELPHVSAGTFAPSAMKFGRVDHAAAAHGQYKSPLSPPGKVRCLFRQWTGWG